MSEQAEIYVVRASGESIVLSVADARSIHRQLGELFGAWFVELLVEGVRLTEGLFGGEVVLCRDHDVAVAGELFGE